MIGYRSPGTQRHWLDGLSNISAAGPQGDHRFPTPFVSHGLASVRLTRNHATSVPLVTNLSPATSARYLMSSPAAAQCPLVCLNVE